MQVERIPRTVLDGVEVRLPRWMAAFAVGGVAGLLVLGQPRMAGGFALGAGLSILGFRWLRAAVATALNASEKGVSKGVAWKLILRYPLAMAAVFVFYQTHWLPFQGVLCGLFVPVAGAVAESIALLGKSIFASRA